MIFGFNTDIRVGERVFHVQTEDRGRDNPVIDTTIYHKGRVLAKRAASYKEYLDSPEFAEDELKELVERYHKRWVEKVKRNELEEMQDRRAEFSGDKIKVSLLNPDSLFRVAGIAVHVGVTDDGNGTPVAGAEVRVQFITENVDAVDITKKSDGRGRVEILIPTPNIGEQGAEIVIEARAGKARDELRYNLRPRGQG